MGLLNTWRAGSNKHDMWAAHEILIAWLLTLDKFMMQLRKNEKRMQIIEEVITNEIFDSRFSAIFGEALSNQSEPVPLNNIFE
jgi:hypothetical protein